ncbi:succinate dehydrogenase, cytochrome b556 subunit [Mesorhizobium sp. J428]|uniref:succinate dehydrogenase, cytochrome b556 subunit n=1 Tax=Mesorhizobium sp. J428 TaxID=2898440 RepID=UPI002150840D|nr:succinate dehydrogenase, cytochrome b556 subunit [Mesorhizobium sp. J428]MCR5856964.1 succinate dehydrogenase, cytochrome b556 subunit [Mesorhizobium sp. J428]
MSAPATRHKPRPLSPHLQVYKFIPTMAMSIFHRITGGALYVGTLVMAWWITAAAGSEDYYGFVSGIVGSWFGQLVLFGFSWALMFHLLGGVRHLIWDTGAYMEKHTATKLAIATAIGSVVLTLAIWIVVFVMRSGA